MYMYQDVRNMNVNMNSLITLALKIITLDFLNHKNRKYQVQQLYFRESYKLFHTTSRVLKSITGLQLSL